MALPLGNRQALALVKTDYSQLTTRLDFSIAVGAPGTGTLQML